MLIYLLKILMHLFESADILSIQKIIYMFSKWVCVNVNIELLSNYVHFGFINIVFIYELLKTFAFYLVTHINGNSL